MSDHTGPLPVADVGIWTERSRTPHRVADIVYLSSTRHREGAHRVTLFGTQLTVYPDRTSSGTVRSRVLRKALDELERLTPKGLDIDDTHFDPAAYVVGRLVCSASATNIHLEELT